MLRRIFMGLPRSELLKYSKLMQGLEPAQMTEDDSQKLQRELNKNLVMKVLAIPTAVLVGYHLPVPPLYLPPVIIRACAGLMVYRVLTGPQNYKTFLTIKEICDKYPPQEVTQQSEEEED